MTAEQVARDLCRVINDVPVIFKLSGIEYAGTRGSLRNEKRNIEGGMFFEPQLTIITCLKKVNSSGKLVDRFPTGGEPALQNVLTDIGGVTGRDYRIVRLHDDEWGMGRQMDLESQYK